jgi:hypothetical protein
VVRNPFTAEVQNTAGGNPMQDPFRGEIQEIMRTYARTRYAKVLLGI